MEKIQPTATNIEHMIDWYEDKIGTKAERVVGAVSIELFLIGCDEPTQATRRLWANELRNALAKRGNDEI